MIIDNFDTAKKIMIIAELSANHGGDINIAKEAIRAAKESGADAVKVQTFTADTLTLNCNNKYFKLNNGTLWDGRTLYDLYEEAYMPWEWQKELKRYANEIGLIFFSTPFDKTAVDFLEEIEVPIYKVASFEINDIPLIEYIASKGKPIIISTGIASISAIDEAIKVCKAQGNEQIILLKCTSSYPADIKDANLKTIQNMKDTFNVEVGVSDHTLGTIAPIVATALGARIIEKHFMLRKELGGPDCEFSLEPTEFQAMAKAVNEAEESIGCIEYDSECIKKNSFLRKSIFISKNVKKGDKINNNNVKVIRPGYGMPPKYLNEIMGMVFRDDYIKGTPLEWNQIRED